jgi:hypothetical protein
MLSSDENRQAIHNTTGLGLQAQQQSVVGSPAAIANACSRAERNGNSWKCNCPICGRHSLSISPGHKVSILIKCWHCEACGINDGYTEQRAHFVALGLLEPNNREPSHLDRARREEFNEERRAEAVQLWNHPWYEPITPERTAAKYLCARGLESFIGHTALKCCGLIMMARVWHVQHGLSAVQYTHLNDKGDDRDRDRDDSRVTKGVRQGGAVWIGAPQPDEEFVVAEGLETCLSAMILLKCRCGAAVLGPNLCGLVLPSRAQLIHIAADNDETGIPAAQRAAKEWRAHGLRVRVSYPKTEGWDFNNQLLGR